MIWEAYVDGMVFREMWPASEELLCKVVLKHSGRYPPREEWEE